MKRVFRVTLHGHYKINEDNGQVKGSVFGGEERDVVAKDDLEARAKAIRLLEKDNGGPDCITVTFAETKLITRLDG